MKIAWATDIHLNCADRKTAENFCERILQREPEILLVGGDIAEANDLVSWLQFLADRLVLPIYFVLGNHDYYGSSIAVVRDEVRRIQSEWLHWLPRAGVVSLTPRVGLVGHGGWGDARCGDFCNSTVMLSDYFLIEDLRVIGKPGVPFGGLDTSKAPLKSKLEELGHDAARSLQPLLAEALARFPEVIVLTHVPPFQEACWYRGRISDPAWLPDFTCQAIGDSLITEISARPDRQVTVLCGHTHGNGESWPLANLQVRTGGAEYGKPDFQIIDLQNG